jgi:hypothetical protein
MKPSFFAYIDESGDEGFRFDSGSPEWFVLSAAITRYENDLETVKVLDKVREQIRLKPKTPLHFRNLKHARRITYVTALSQGRLRAISILVHKPSLTAKETFQKRNVLYFYAVRYLLERVSWFCREHHRKDCGDGSAILVFSKRKNMSYDEMKNYIDILKEKSEHQDIQIDWRAFRRDQFQVYPHAERMGLQIADAIASSLFTACQPSVYGYVKPQYAQILRPIVYKRKGRYLGYGLKFWPFAENHISEILKQDWVAGGGYRSEDKI